LPPGSCWFRAYSSVKSVDFSWTAQPYIPEDRTLQDSVDIWKFTASKISNVYNSPLGYESDIFHPRTFLLNLFSQASVSCTGHVFFNIGKFILEHATLNEFPSTTE
jgi:hypothetical protein